MRKSVLCGFALVLLVAGCARMRPGERRCVLAPGEFEIVVAEDASPAIAYAGEELARFLGEALGEAPPVLHRTARRRPRIVLRTTESAAKTSSEGFRIRIEPRRILIEGDSPRGTLYGAYQFLEDQAGVRFLTADHTHVPNAPRLALAPGETACAPPFAMRWSFYYELNEHPAFAARLRNNGTTHAPEFGGAAEAPLIQHSMHRLVPVETYGEAHPEYFAQVDGARMLEVPMGEPQVCSTNPAVIDLVTEEVLRQLREHPEQNVVSVSPNDNALYCTCPACAALDAREGTHMGAHLALVNAVAERVAETHPDATVGTLAYWHTRTPPRHMGVAPNVRIQFCTFEHCALHAIDDPDCPPNAAVLEDLEGWLRLTDDVWVWHYVANLRHLDLSLPNWKALGPAVRGFRDAGVRGLFLQGNGRCPAGELSDLRNYVASRLMWNPDADVERLVEEFTTLHYGEEAGAIHAYIATIQGAVPDGLHPSVLSSVHDMRFSRDAAESVAALFNAAIQRAEDDAIRRRLRKASLPAHRIAAEAGGALTYAAGRLRVAYPSGLRPLIAQYPAVCGEFGMDRDAEFTPMAAYFEALQRNISGASAKRLENENWRVTLAPPMGGVVVDLLHKPSGCNLLHAYGNSGVNLPYGTLRERMLLPASTSADRFSCETQGTRATLQRELSNGSQYTRTLALADGFQTKSRFVYRGETGVQAQFETIAEIHVEGLEPPEVWTAKADGSWKRLAPHRVRAMPYAPMAVEAPGGLLLVSLPEPGGAAVLRFDAGQFEPPRCAWNPGLQQIEVYLRTKTVRLRQGGAFGFAYSLDYVANPALFRAKVEGARSRKP